MKHLLNNLTEQEKNSIREQHTGGMNVVTENFSKLINAKSGDVKPLIKEDVGLTYDKPSKEGRNNPDWVNLVSNLKTVTYPPKI